MEKTVLVVIPAEERHKEKLERAGKGCRFVYETPQTATEEMIEAADVIIGNVKPDRLHEPERLQWLQLNSAGADAYVKPGVLRSTTMLTSATGAYGKAVAEHSFAMLLMLQKKLNLYRDAQTKNEWSDFGTVTSITDATVLGGTGRYRPAFCQIGQCSWRSCHWSETLHGTMSGRCS